MANQEGMHFPPKVTRSRTYCCVHTCKSRASRDPTLRFHFFPPPERYFVNIVNDFGVIEKVDRRKAWEIALKMNKDATSSLRVCSLHFRRDDYILPDVPAMSRHLKTNAVPSCNLPITTNDTKLRNNRARLRKRPKKAGQQFPITQNQEQILITNEMNTPMRIQSRVLIERGSQTINRSVNFSDYFCPTVTNNSDLIALTGISNFSTLENLVKAVLKVFPPLQNYSHLNIQNQIVLTFLKLKHNVSYSVLALIFKCTGSNCKKIVYQMLDILSSILKNAIPWNSKSRISQKLPTFFKEYKNVRVVIHCIEVFIQRPKNLCCQVKTYSGLKGSNTVKFMIGVTPNRVISFVSKSYSGRVLNSVIFEHSGLIDLLYKQDAVMVTDDFIIDNICSKANVSDSRIFSSSSNRQLTKVERLFDAKFMNQSLKTFRILGTKMPVDLVNKSDQIFTIICATLNLNSGLLWEFS